MNPDLDSRRALSFGQRAELYDRVRPGYPAAAVDLALRALPQGPYRVADVGAGTGKLSAALVAAGHDVVAVEPDAAMRGVLEDRVPGVRVLAGRGEELPLPDGAADAVLYGQAWHWVDEPVAAREAARVLRPAGVLAMLWNYEDGEATPWAAELERLVEVVLGDDLPPDPPELPGFGPGQVLRTAWTREQPVDELVDFALSHSAVAVRPEAEREALLDEVRRLAREHPDLRGRERVAVPMGTVCWAYRRT